tara:strand:+ start:16125 stop:18107 length:1983 start_codon:yes stop_codon:yes gene_type:complete
MSLSLKYIVNSTIFLSLLIASFNGFAAAPNCDSLRMDAAANKAYDLIETNPDSSIYYSNIVLQQSRYCNLPRYEALGYKFLGTAHYFNNNFEKAILYQTKAAESFDALHDSSYTSDALLLLSNALLAQGAVKQAQIQTSKAIEYIYYKDAPVLDLAYGISSVSYVEYALYNWEKAKQYAREAIDLFSKAEDYDPEYDGAQLQGLYLSLTDIYLQEGSLDSAAYYLDLIQQQNSFFSSTGHEMYYVVERVQLAHQNGLSVEKTVQQLEEIKQSYENKPLSVIDSLEIEYALAKVWLVSDAPGKGIQLLRTMLTDDYAQSDFLFQKKLLNTLLNHYESIENTAKAYATFKELDAIERHLNEIDFKVNNASIELKEQLLKKKQLEQEKKQLLIVKEEQETQLSRTNFILVFVGVSLVALVILLLYSWHIHRERKHILQSKNKIISVLGHDLRTPISQVQNIVFLMKEEMLSEKELAPTLGKIDLALNQTQQSLENVLNWSKTQLENLSPSPEEVDLSTAVKSAIEFNKMNLNAKKITVQTTISDAYLVKFDPQHLQIIIRNLISNAIKYSSTYNLIQISAEPNAKNTKVTLSIQDQGAGMSAEKVKQIMRKTINKSTEGTKGETGTGLGLMLVKQFLKVNNGTLHIDSIPEKGSTFSITLPLA